VRAGRRPCAANADAPDLAALQLKRLGVDQKKVINFDLMDLHVSSHSGRQLSWFVISIKSRDDRKIERSMVI
jgi:hypothetical protein